MQARVEFGSPEYAEAMSHTYDEALLACMDTLGREDCYGVAAWRGVRLFGELLGLTTDSNLLDIGSGVGGPARLFARTYGCKVTGIDLSEPNHRTAITRTKGAGLDHLASFIHGDALTTPLPEHHFTHVFGCEAWCYFPDKVRLYRAAHRALRPGGRIAFLEAACDAPVRLVTEDHLTPVRYESVARYTAMLREAGFENVRHHDTTEAASRDITDSLYRLITRKAGVACAAGTEIYFALLEIWAEILAYFSEGKLTHCGIIADKK
jgi:ubiquinone/menaquinone biosynthesis C-methylase UbiE